MDVKMRISSPWFEVGNGGPEELILEGLELCAFPRFLLWYSLCI
jgi:hypothetical protein